MIMWFYKIHVRTMFFFQSNFILFFAANKITRRKKSN